MKLILSIVLTLLFSSTTYAETIRFSDELICKGCERCVKPSKKKPTGKKVKKKQKQKREKLPACEITETIFVQALPEFQDFNPRWNMPLPPVRNNQVPQVYMPQSSTAQYATPVMSGGQVYVASTNRSSITTSVVPTPLPPAAVLFAAPMVALLRKRVKR